MEARLWAKVRKTADCWVWTAGRTRKGYGSFKLNGKTVSPHRITFAMEYGEIPASLMIDHTCHNHACVRPSHLRAVTNKQNLENHSGAYKTSQSGVRGVRQRKDSGRWEARVTHNSRTLNLGYFDSLEEASEAVTAKRNELFTHNDADRSRA